MGGSKDDAAQDDGVEAWLWDVIALGAPIAWRQDENGAYYWTSVDPDKTLFEVLEPYLK